MEALKKKKEKKGFNNKNGKYEIHKVLVYSINLFSHEGLKMFFLVFLQFQPIQQS